MPSISFQELIPHLVSAAPRLLLVLIALGFWLARSGRGNRGIRLLGAGLLSELAMITVLPAILIIAMKSSFMGTTNGASWIHLVMISVSTLGSIPLAVIIYAAFLLAREAEEMSESPPEQP